uniref:Major facilitator superfamily (MFS) profile domain-containing protein n=1 Tax=Candidatus Kentrum sp. SD TaxID=2126332 RepID=A0A451BK87_9GAMM|nr:MAG: hypothetical protein BECKSD772D_GA0070982_102228 [Candidatus Kentron sp. SD]
MAIAVGIVAGTAVNKAPVALLAVRANLALTLLAAGWVISVFNSMPAVLGIAGGMLADRAGARRVRWIATPWTGHGGK